MQNNLFGHRVLAHLIKRRIWEELIPNQGGPKSNGRCLCKRQSRRDTDTEKEPHEDKDRDGRDVATSPGTPGAPVAGKGGRTFPWSFGTEHGPDPPVSQWPWPTWISDSAPLLQQPLNTNTTTSTDDPESLVWIKPCTQVYCVSQDYGRQDQGMYPWLSSSMDIQNQK